MSPSPTLVKRQFGINYENLSIPFLPKNEPHFTIAFKYILLFSNLSHIVHKYFLKQGSTFPCNSAANNWCYGRSSCIPYIPFNLIKNSSNYALCSAVYLKDPFEHFCILICIYSDTVYQNENWTVSYWETVPFFSEFSILD